MEISKGVVISADEVLCPKDGNKVYSKYTF
jgi:hypothetical protein